MKYYMTRHKTDGKVTKTTFRCEYTLPESKAAVYATELTGSTTWQDEIPNGFGSDEDVTEELTRDELIDEIGLQAVLVLEPGC